MGEPTAALGTHDVAQELRRSEEQFRLLVQGVTDYAIYMLDPTGRVTSWNAGAERIKGYRADDIVGRHFSTFYTPEDRETGLPAEALATALRDGRFEREGWRLRQDGTRFWANVIVDPIYDDDGHLVGFAKVTRDMTEKKRLADELEAARAEAHQAQKMAAIAQLASGIAHDFNNLLTVVLGNLDMLKRAKEERRPRLIENALKAVEQARRLTSKLLAFSRRQTLFPQSVDLNGLIAGMDDMLAQSLRGDIRLELDLAADLWPVEVDPSQFQIALVNLAVNARDAMPDGGSLRIRTANAAGQGPDRVAVTVSDTGSGIPEEIQSKVFEPFFTTKGVGQGTGLGLAQVYGFAEQSRGSVTLQSSPGQGTTITLSLPRSATMPAGGDEVSEEGVEGTQPLNILVVEDNLQVAEVASSLLKEHRHTVAHVETADEALRILEGGARFDLLFTDLVMPGKLDGLDLAREVRSRWPATSILLATGYSDAASRATEEGFKLLSKPYQPQTLLGAVQKAAASRFEVGEPA